MNVNSASALPDEDVVDRIRDGDLGLFEVVMRRYNQRLYRVARAIVKDDAEAEDVVQQAYINAYRHLDQYAARAKFSTWLTRIVVNEALGRAKRRARLLPLAERTTIDSQGGTMPAPRSTAPDPEAHAYSRELAAVLERAIESLPDSFRAVFVMRDVEGLSALETAECLGLNAETVKTRLHRARVRLRRDLTNRVGASASTAYQFGSARCDAVVARVLAALARFPGVTPTEVLQP